MVKFWITVASENPETGISLLSYSSCHPSPSPTQGSWTRHKSLFSQMSTVGNLLRINLCCGNKWCVKISKKEDFRTFPTIGDHDGYLNSRQNRLAHLMTKVVPQTFLIHFGYWRSSRPDKRVPLWQHGRVGMGLRSRWWRHNYHISPYISNV